MDRAAALLNDPAKTDYTYVAQLPYLNTAIDELLENLEESNSSPTNQTSASITIPIGINKITPIEDTTVGQPHYPIDLVEIQQIGERSAGTNDSFLPMIRRDFTPQGQASNILGSWAWENQIIKFNSGGSLTAREVLIKYVRQPIQLATDQTSIIGTIGVRSYLSYKTAGLCAMFIGENPTRAATLDGQAERSMDRLIGINNKGRQEMVTRRRPFRAGYKRRGWI